MTLNVPVDEPIFTGNTTEVRHEYDTVLDRS
jgi:hypothetical protein